jgi:hypothetical protein
MYKCECGKSFVSSQSLNAHAGRCRHHLGEERFASVESKRRARISKTLKKVMPAIMNKRKEDNKLRSESEWNSSEHKCEFCGVEMAEKFASGRFCSRDCALKFSYSHYRQPSKEIRVCEECGNKLERYNSRFCSFKCNKSSKHKELIADWKSNENKYSGKNKQSVPEFIRKYMIDKSGGKCERCGWCETNPSTGKTPLHVHHLDGNYSNNRESNLEVLCPNCHSITESFGSLNIGKGRPRNRKGG